MTFMRTQVEELVKKDHTQENKIDQLELQLVVKESADTYLGTIAVEGHRMTGNEVQKDQVKGSRHEVEYCNGVRSVKETPCEIGLNKLLSVLVGIVINFVVLSLIVYFGISFFYFILTTTDSVSEKMGTTLKRGVMHVLATVRLSGGTERAQHGKTLTQMDFKGEKETKENSEQELR